MDLFDLLQEHAAVFLLVLTRCTGLFMIAPFLGSMNVPQTIRAGAAVTFAIVLFPVVDGTQASTAPPSLLAYTGAVFSEIFIGWLIGFVAFVSFAAINMAGKLMDMQVGFSIVNVVDPTSGQQVPLIGSFLYNFALIIFVVTNGHHMLISALAASFQTVPMMGLDVDPSIASMMTRFTTGIFLTGVQLALPVVFAMLMTNVGLGILARTMPQLNIFVVGVPLHLIVGLFVIMIVLPFFIMFMDVVFDAMYGNITVAFRALR